MKTIAIIGAGVMGRALAQGLLDQRVITPQRLILSDRIVSGLGPFRKRGASITRDNKKAVQSAGIVLLAVKPQIMPAVFKEVAPVISKKQLLISIAAGVSISTIQKHSGGQQPIVRVMPNLGARVGESMSAWTANTYVTRNQKAHAKRILKAIGQESYVASEKKIDAITVIAGSGPAYFFYLAELIEQAASKLGIQKDSATMLIRQTLIGTSKVAQHTEASFSKLRQDVSSKGGVTEKVCGVLDDSDIKDVLISAIQAGHKRAQELNR